jgi:hypothetical protein
LDLQITESTGLGSTVTGLGAEGSGAFVDEGTFGLSVSLVLSGAKPPDGVRLKTILRGTSRISCSAAERILITQRGTGSTPRLGAIEAELQHEVGNTGCFS